MERNWNGELFEYTDGKSKVPLFDILVDFLMLPSMGGAFVGFVAYLGVSITGLILSIPASIIVGFMCAVVVSGAVCAALGVFWMFYKIIAAAVSPWITLFFGE
jgi:hypothetical protein